MKALKYILISGLALLLALGGYLAWQILMPLDSQQIVLRVESGDNARTIAQRLPKTRLSAAASSFCCWQNGGAPIANYKPELIVLADITTSIRPSDCWRWQYRSHQDHHPTWFFHVSGAQEDRTQRSGLLRQPLCQGHRSGLCESTHRFCLAQPGGLAFPRHLFL